MFPDVFVVTQIPDMWPVSTWSISQYWPWKPHLYTEELGLCSFIEEETEILIVKWLVGYSHLAVECSASWERKDSAFRVQDVIDVLCLRTDLGSSQLGTCWSWAFSAAHPCPCSQPWAFPLLCMHFREVPEVSSAPLEPRPFASDTPSLSSFCLLLSCSSLFRNQPC